jgi:glutamate-1-semialdehyde 2,1-aminomutase
VAAFVGRAEIMEALAWGGVLHYGTQNSSRLGLFATRANLVELGRDDGAVFRHTWKIGEKLRNGLSEVLTDTGTPAIVQGVGPMFQIFFTEQQAITDYRDFCAHVDRDSYRRFALALFERGVYMSPSAALHSVVSAAHTDKEVERTLAAAKEVLSDDKS